MSKRSILAYPTHTMTEPLGFPSRFASNCRVLTSLPIQSVHVSDWAKLLACGDASGEVETVNLRKKQSAKFVSKYPVYLPQTSAYKPSVYLSRKGFLDGLLPVGLQGSTLRPVGLTMRPAFTQWRLNSHAWSRTWPPR